MFITVHVLFCKKKKSFKLDHKKENNYPNYDAQYKKHQLFVHLYFALDNRRGACKGKREVFSEVQDYFSFIFFSPEQLSHVL